MTPLKRISWVLLANGILAFLVVRLNSNLSDLPFHVFVAGLFIAYPALKMPWPEGLATVVLTGFLASAGTPLPPVVLPAAFGLLFALLHQARMRFRSRKQYYLMLVASGANLLLYAALSLVLLPEGAGFAYAGRALVELAASQAVVAAAAFWFYDLLDQGFVLLGVTPSADELA